MEFKKDYDDLVKNYRLEKLEIESDDLDHKVPAIYAKKDGNKNVAVLVHGMGGTKETVSPIMKTFLDLGYDLSLIHISEPTRPCGTSRMPSSA